MPCKLCSGIHDISGWVGLTFSFGCDLSLVSDFSELSLGMILLPIDFYFEGMEKIRRRRKKEKKKLKNWRLKNEDTFPVKRVLLTKYPTPPMKATPKMRRKRLDKK